MSRSYQQIRQLTAQESGLFWFTGTADSSGNSTSILRDSALTIYGNDRLNGFHLLLTSGSPTFTELHVKDFFQSDGDARFEPELGAAPNSLNYEVLPFAGTDFLRAIQDAIYETYDRGWLARDFWMRMVGGSPLYNADFAYWTSATALDGWTANVATFARERASENIALSETSLSLTTAAGYAALNEQWKRYLNDFKGQTVTWYCWVRTATASNARLNLNNGSDNYSTYHSGGGDWELLHVEVNTSNTDTDIEPRLYIDTNNSAFFNMPFLLAGGSRSSSRIREYPFVHQVMPDGPYELTVTLLDIRKDELATGRGLGDRRQLRKQRRLLNPRVVKHHDENTTTQVGVLDFSQSRTPPRDGELLWLRGDSPLTVPTTVLSTDNLEVTETESLLLAKLAAANLLKRGMAGAATSVRRTYGERITQLRRDLDVLASGAGESRDTATYGLGW